MKNDIVTDVSYFRLNRKTQQKKYSIFTVISLIVTILLTILPIVYSIPHNQIELPKDASNYLKNGIEKADNLTANEFLHSNISNNNNDESNKHVHRRKGGKHHHKKFNSKKHIKLDQKNNDSLNDLTMNKYKYFEKNENKFDYYPIEPVDMQYDPKEDEKIRFVLITGNDQEIKSKNENKKKRKRQKRDVSTILEDENLNRSKRNPLLLSSIDRDYYAQFKLNEPRYTQENSVQTAGVRYAKFPIRGFYYNTYTPHKLSPFDKNLPDVEVRFNPTSGQDTGGPVWDRRPANRIPDSEKIPTKVTTVKTTTTTPIKNTVSSGPSNCIWAIVNCCSRSNLTIRYGCFEQIGCSGAFWDFNPCGDAWQRKAVEIADKFFEEDDLDYN